MSDVVARVLRSLGPSLERVEYSLDSLLAAHDLSPKTIWSNPAARIPWNCFAEVLEDAADRLGGPQALEAVGA